MPSAAVVEFYQFGIGSAFARPYGINAAGNPTPQQMVTLQDISTEFTFANKPLMGQYQYPVAVARGEGKVDIKIKWARLGLKLLNDLMFSGTVQTGQDIIYPNFQVAAAASITIAPPNSGTFVADQGVLDANGNQMVLVTTAPTQGQYEVVNSTGVYTFASAETGTIQISYVYSITGGHNVAIPNKPMGAQPLIELWVFNNNWSNNLAMRFPGCTFTKFGIPQKNTVWSIPDYECSAFSDGLGNICYMYSD
jgi:hypothetical protein